MTAPSVAVCPWPVDTSCVKDWDDLDAGLKERSVAMASSVLRALTGYRVGECPTTIRPCRHDRYSGAWTYGAPFHPTINRNGDWINVVCGCSGDCSCSSVCEVLLPPPVYGIDQVLLDGVILDASEYRLAGRKLIRTGDECWPMCQDMSKPAVEGDDGVGTFSVTYKNSAPVDGFGALAAGILAGEFAKACSGKSCRLPSGVTQIVRQGVTMTVSSGSFPDGTTGISEVDAYIFTVNPNHHKMPFQIGSPDMRVSR